MEVIPALDLRDGRCVRLYQGDYDRETIYSDDPAETATRWVDMGATRLHVVDLDGARDGAQPNMTAVKRIAAAVSVPIQLGGGVRGTESARAALSAGVDRVIVGTAAVDEPDTVRMLCEDLGSHRVVVSVDARDGLVALDGWTRPSRMQAQELMDRMADMGVERFLYTDITRDGTLTEPNFAAIQDLMGRQALRLLAAGGVASVAHLQRLADLGVEGAVVGTALYTGDLDLPEALSAMERRQATK